jgi:outer membrane protein assembly factor BamD
MMQSTTSSRIQLLHTDTRSFFTELRIAFATGIAVAALLATTAGASAQDATTTPAPTAAPMLTSLPPVATAPDAATPAKPDIALSNKKAPKERKQKVEKVVASKDTKQEEKKARKIDPIEKMDANLPDKALYDKAQDAVKHGRYDVARLDLQTLLNTYPDSQYMMRAKLGVADSWFKEGGSAALVQAEQEYTDFITFFPNSPEAAEAQMRVGDIYFRQMDKPDRDYSNTVKAEEAYRLMIQQFPDSTLVPQAKQRLREVQEVLASREADIASFYASHANWSAVIARDQTVVDTYPLYSRMDDVLVGLADAYGAEARIVRAAKLPEAAKARLLKIDEDQEYAALSKVVLEHPAAAHVEDARDRIVGMGRPIPTPTPEQIAASAALENSRGQYSLSSRVEFFVLHKADTVPAATTGEPPLEDAKPTLAPTIFNQAMDDYRAALNPATYATHAAPLPTPENSATPQDQPAAPAAPLALQDVPAAGNGAIDGSAVASVPATSSAPSSGGTSMGIEIIQPSANSPAPTPTNGTPPAFPGNESTPPAPASAPAQTNGNMDLVQPDATPAKTLTAPIEKPAAAPDAINEIPPGSHPSAQAVPTDGKAPKPVLDKSDESSSRHKKKKGLAKLNPL